MFLEHAAAGDRNSHGLHVAGGYHAIAGIINKFGARGLALNREAVRSTLVSKRQHAGEARIPHPRQGANTLQHAIKELGSSRELIVFRFRDIHTHRQHMIGAEARIHSAQIRKAA